MKRVAQLAEHVIKNGQVGAAPAAVEAAELEVADVDESQVIDWPIFGEDMKADRWR